jgi:hypothetical protein
LNEVPDGVTVEVVHFDESGQPRDHYSVGGECGEHPPSGAEHAPSSAGTDPYALWIPPWKEGNEQDAGR